MKIRSLIAAAALVTLAGCAKDKPAATGTAEGTQAAAPAANTPAAPVAAPAAPAGEHPIVAEVGGEAASVFRMRCGTCHGLSGKGDGAAAQALNPKPRSFEDSAWQGTITDDHIRTVIVKGGPAVGKSPLMAPNPDLEAKPEVIDGLLKIVRGMKK